MPTMTGEEMKTLRKAARMSQAELAGAIGMSRETIGQMERDQAPIELRTKLATEMVCRLVAMRNLMVEAADSGVEDDVIVRTKAHHFDRMIELAGLD